MGNIVVHLSERLELRISSRSDGGSKSIAVRLNRIAAQALADALQQFAGAAPRARSLGPSIGVIGTDLDPIPAPRKAGVIRVGKGKNGPLPVVRLNTRR